MIKLHLRTMTKVGKKTWLEIPPLQNTTTDVVIVANRLIKRVMNVHHDAVSVQSAKKWVIGQRVAVETKICRTQ